MSIVLDYEGGLLDEVAIHLIKTVECKNLTTGCVVEFSDDHHTVIPYLTHKQAEELRDQLIAQFPLSPSPSSEPVPVLLRLTPGERASLKQAIENIDDEELEARMEATVGAAAKKV